MLIVSHVCAEFTLPDGTIFRIRPENRRSFLSVPDVLSRDLLFQALLEDGSIESAESKQARSRLERDPDANISPDGKKKPAPAEAPAAPAKTATRAPKNPVPKTAADAAPRSGARAPFEAAADAAASTEAARTAPAASQP